VLISVLFWFFLTLAAVGLLLLFVALGCLIFLFAQSAFITHLKGSGLRITEQQYPDLHRRLLACCDKVGVETPPKAYLLRADFFNALATRFLGRNFVVLFADVVDIDPRLSKRMASALAMRRDEDIVPPRRHWFVWFLSLFVPRLGGGGMLLIVIVTIGILAAIAIPTFQDYTVRAQIALAHQSGAALQSEVVDYAVQNDQWPASFQEG
jgi:hypothetical protein